MKTLMIAALMTMPLQMQGKGEEAYPSVLPYASIQGWSVLIDMNEGPSCYLLGTYGAGTIVRMGVDSIGRATLALANARWKRMKNGYSYDAMLRFDGRSTWKGRAGYSHDDGIGTMLFRFTDAGFVKAFMSAKVLTMKVGRMDLAEISLKGSGEALGAMVRCQNEVEVVRRAADREDMPQAFQDAA